MIDFPYNGYQPSRLAKVKFYQPSSEFQQVGIVVWEREMYVAE